MAKINDFELRGITNFRGHEQEDLIQGNIYYKGKKVGWYSQDSWGGCDHIDLDYTLPKELLKEINDILDNYESETLFNGISDLYDKTYNIKFDHKIFKGGEFLFGDLIQLDTFEKKYKKFSKQWGVNNIAICYKDLFSNVIKGSKLPKNEFEKILNSDKEIKLYYLYTSLNDFNVDTRKESEE